MKYTAAMVDATPYNVMAHVTKTVLKSCPSSYDL